jgi:hypothetical protein
MCGWRTYVAVTALSAVARVAAQEGALDTLQCTPPGGGSAVTVLCHLDACTRDPNSDGLELLQQDAPTCGVFLDVADCSHPGWTGRFIRSTCPTLCKDAADQELSDNGQETSSEDTICAVNPCRNGGECLLHDAVDVTSVSRNPSDTTPTFVCKCPTGFGGRRCEDTVYAAAPASTQQCTEGPLHHFQLPSTKLVGVRKFRLNGKVRPGDVGGRPDDATSTAAETLLQCAAQCMNYRVRGTEETCLSFYFTFKEASGDSARESDCKLYSSLVTKTKASLKWTSEFLRDKGVLYRRLPQPEESDTAPRGSLGGYMLHRSSRARNAARLMRLTAVNSLEDCASHCSDLFRCTAFGVHTKKPFCELYGNEDDNGVAATGKPVQLVPTNTYDTRRTIRTSKYPTAIPLHP